MKGPPDENNSLRSKLVVSIDIVSEVNVRKSPSVKFNKLTEFDISQNVLFENGIKRNLSEKKDAQNTLLISNHSRKIKHRMIESKSSKMIQGSPVHDL